MESRKELGALRPVWPDASRLCPDRPLPAYRHVPGLTPHPAADPEGHCYGGAPALSVEPPWASCEAYRFGIDLYHQGYLWESHEAWEPLWHAAGRDSLEGRFIQALIRNSAALLKAHLGNRRGALSHSHGACALLESVLEEVGKGGKVLEVKVETLRARFEACYEPLWDSPDIGAGVPLGERPWILLPHVS